MRAVDLTHLIGKTFGCLTVEGINPLSRYTKARVRCRCACGNIAIVAPHPLKTNPLHCRKCKPNSSKPGAVSTKYVVNIGDRFGRLVVQALLYEKRVYKAKSVCDCGNTVVSSRRSLCVGDAQSCGCRRKQKLARIGIGVSPQKSQAVRQVDDVPVVFRVIKENPGLRVSQVAKTVGLSLRRVEDAVWTLWHDGKVQNEPDSTLRVTREGETVFRHEA